MLIFILWLVLQVIFAILWMAFIGSKMPPLSVLFIVPGICAVLAYGLLCLKDKKLNLINQFNENNKCYPVLLCVIACGVVLAERFALAGAQDDAMYKMEQCLKAPTLLLFAFSGVIIAPITEEIIFRGFVLNTFLRWGKLIATIVTSVLFAAVHCSWAAFPYIFVLSVYLCWLRFQTKNIYNSMIFHSFNNLFAIISNLI